MRAAHTWFTLLALAGSVTAQEIDAAALVTAPGTVSVAADAKVGYAVTQTFRGGGIEQRSHFAVVGEDAETFRVEHGGPGIDALAATLPELQGARMALVVRKSDGRVLEAWLGKPGEALRAIAIGPAAPPRTPPPAEEGELKLPWDTVPASIHKGPQGTQWIGREGELEGVLLKRTQAGGGGYELTAPPQAGEQQLGGETLATRTLTYSNGQVLVLADDPVVEAFFPTGVGGMLAMRTPQVAVEVSARSTQAQPTLRWDDRAGDPPQRDR